MIEETSAVISGHGGFGGSHVVVHVAVVRMAKMDLVVMVVIEEVTMVT